MNVNNNKTKTQHNKVNTDDYYFTFWLYQSIGAPGRSNVREWDSVSEQCVHASDCVYVWAKAIRFYLTKTYVLFTFYFALVLVIYFFIISFYMSDVCCCCCLIQIVFCRLPKRTHRTVETRGWLTVVLRLFVLFLFFAISQTNVCM